MIPQTEQSMKFIVFFLGNWLFPRQHGFSRTITSMVLSSIYGSSPSFRWYHHDTRRRQLSASCSIDLISRISGGRLSWRLNHEITDSRHYRNFELRPGFLTVLYLKPADGRVPVIPAASSQSNETKTALLLWQLRDRARISVIFIPGVSSM